LRRLCKAVGATALPRLVIIGFLGLHCVLWAVVNKSGLEWSGVIKEATWKHEKFNYVFLNLCQPGIKNFNRFQFKLLSWIPTVWSKLIFQKISNLQSSKAPLHNRSLRKTNIKHCKIMCWFELDIGPGSTEGTVVRNSLLDW
jgi:hypothetical protein